MSSYDYSRVNRDAIKRLSRWYSGDIQDVMDKHGFYGFLQGISLQSVLKPGQVICGPVHTVLYERAHGLANRRMFITARSIPLLMVAFCWWMPLVPKVRVRAN